MYKLTSLVVVCSLLCGLALSQDFADSSAHHHGGKKNKIAKCRQNYMAECEEAINGQINLELYASHVYLSMSFYFDRSDVDLPGFAKFFKDSSDEEREHATLLMRYQNQRGGRVKMMNVTKPVYDEWGTGRGAMLEALALEKEVNLSLLKIESLANDNGDPHLADFITENFLTEQVESIEELSRHVASLDRVGPNLGEYMYDRKLLGKE
ncbi:soma ferritin-like isoform X2 [Glandiceps talaboti]